MLTIGRYRIGRTFWVQTRALTTVRRFLCFWVLKEARPQDVDRELQFPPGTGMEHDGRVYRYWKAGEAKREGAVKAKGGETLTLRP